MVSNGLENGKNSYKTEFLLLNFLSNMPKNLKAVALYRITTITLIFAIKQRTEEPQIS